MNKDKKAKDVKKTQNFAAAFDHLQRTQGVKSQQDLADRMGVTKDTISRILRGANDVSEKTITKLQTASGCVFNLQFLRGKSDVMLAETNQKSINEEQNLQQSTQIDPSSMVNAIIASHNVAIASKDETIASLQRELAKSNEQSKRELAEKEQQIKLLQEEVKSWKAEAASWQKHVEALRQQLAQQQTKDNFGKYPFTIGAAEQDVRPKPTAR